MKKNILNLTAGEAKDFFLKPKSYISVSIPNYFDFSKLLEGFQSLLENSSVSDFSNEYPKKQERKKGQIYLYGRR